eukprot:CAMPEP_0198718382 /NCGR_PEP_ID=MMETSP1471-20131121/50386_1 /TAXON_ID=41880 /ORGANISM="Pycnococcus provasolii, Strain RCC733" /LENGTH=55 /DNA_ID=CAMNT_0044479057 /DNA_START=65 /DNA_END=229 /DNA_ORIENTATION=-
MRGGVVQVRSEVNAVRQATLRSMHGNGRAWSAAVHVGNPPQRKAHDGWVVITHPS